MSASPTPGAAAPLAPAAGAHAGELSAKGLSAGAVGVLGAVVIGISTIAPAYTLTASLGPTVAVVGTQVPAIILVGFISQLSNNPDIADLAFNPFVNVVVCLLFMLGATLISYRDMQTTQKFQYVLVGFQVVVLVLFAVVAIVKAVQGDAPDPTAFSWSWFNPFEVSSFSAFAAGLSLSIFIFWGWDVVLTMNEETKNPAKTPGRAAMLTVVIVVSLYLLLSIGLIMFAGVGDGPLGLANEDISANVFFALSDPILGPLAFLVSLAVLSSSAASLKSTAVGPARTLLAMGQ